MNVEDKLTQHFVDDERNFGRINATLERYEEIMKQNGEHFSYISRDITLIKESLDKMEKKYQPVTDWFNNINFLKNATMWILGAVVIFGSAIASLPLIKQFLAKFFQ